jgi:hypothetical protein
MAAGPALVTASASTPAEPQDEGTGLALPLARGAQPADQRRRIQVQPRLLQGKENLSAMEGRGCSDGKSAAARTQGHRPGASLAQDPSDGRRGRTPEIAGADGPIVLHRGARMTRPTSAARGRSSMGAGNGGSGAW